MVSGDFLISRGIVAGLSKSDSNQLDFRNPEAFYHDVNSVAGLLKQFFRDLPDPLLTQEQYQGFIEAARKSPGIAYPILTVPSDPA